MKRPAARRARGSQPFFVWKTRFTLGASDVDGEHRHFFEIANRLRIAMLSGEGDAAVRQALLRMADHASTHFPHEEACLAASDCPALAEHREEHRRFVSAVAALNAQERPSAEAAFCLARDWILDHILGMDRRDGSWIARPVPRR